MYHLHFRQTDFPFIFTDIVFRQHSYGQFEYVLLQRKDECVGYLTNQGITQAYAYGERLLNTTYAEEIVSRMEKLLEVLRAFPDEYQGKAGTDLVARWIYVESVCDALGQLYLNCEQPILAPLEEVVKREYDAKLSERLTQFGEFKFNLHNAMGPLFEALYALCESVADRLQVPVEQVLLFRSAEMYEALLTEKDVIQKAIRDRLDGIVFLPHEGAFGRIGVGEEYQEWKSKLEQDNLTCVQGQTAYRGKARGIVKVHLSLIKTAEILPGTVLVSGMTNPQIVPFLGNAVAIVTDEGGLTCHAAIISREMKIPCVVGTKKATQVFADGDLVEVDADKGIVRKINE